MVNSSRRKSVAYVVIVAMFIVIAGGDLLQAGGRWDGAEPAAAPALAVRSVEPAPPVNVAEIRERLKLAILRAEKSGDTDDHERLQGMQLFLDIGSASSASERHELIKRLPVKIVKTAEAREFWAGGKMRFRVATSMVPSLSGAAESRPGGGGPSDSADAPAGIDDCAPDTCATAQDGLDALALAASLQSAIDGAEANLAEAQAGQEHEFASRLEESGGALVSVPASCGNEDDAYVFVSCVMELLTASIDIGGAVWARYVLYGMAADIMAGAVVATGLVVGSAVAASAAVVGAVVAAYVAVNCVRGSPK